MIEILPLPAFKDNYIWLLRAAGQVAVVDPGDAAPVLDHLKQHSARLCAILLTHHHADHVGGVAEILAQCPAPVPVFGPAAECISGVTRPLADGDHIEIPEIGARLDVLAVPGHTRGHIAYYGASIRADGAVFCGDTLFAGGCGRLFEGTPQQMHNSLARLAALPTSTWAYCAHEYTQANLRFAVVVEPDNIALQARCKEVAARRAAGQSTVPSQIAMERATNPFLRCNEVTVKAAAALRLGRPPHDTVESFKAIREWKNSF